MLALLRDRLRLSSSPQARPGPRRDRSRSRRPGLEALEPRVALSLGVESIVPTNTASDQWDSATASSAGGRSVVVWSHRISGSDTSIKAQLYDAAGDRIGGEIIVNDSPGTVDGSPAVAMNSSGDFVVAWTRSSTSIPTTLFRNKDVLAARFDSTGTNLDGPNRHLPVAGTAKDESEPSVAITDGDREGLIGWRGDFVVAYTLAYGETNTDVYARRFRAGVPSWTAPVATSGANESAPSIALYPARSGVVAIAFQQQAGGSDTNIAMARLSTQGSPIDMRAVASTTNRELAPSVGIDANGYAVVAYEYEHNSSDHDICARRVSNAGMLGPLIAVESSTLFQSNPVVALQPTTGRFVVAYEAGTGAGRSVAVEEFGADDSLLGSYNAGSSRAAPAVSIDGQGNYQVTYTSLTATTTDVGLGVRRRRGRL